MDEKQQRVTENNSAADSGKKKRYHSPEIQRFGRVRELTTGGSGRKRENMGMDFKPNRKP